MRRAAIVGMGQASATGTGVEALRRALAGAPTSATPMACGVIAEEPFVSVLRARVEAPPGLIDPRKMRRMDGYTGGALLAAAEALGQGRESVKVGQERIGVVLATGRGALGASFAFLDDVIDKGDRRGSPITFASSVHGAPTSAISSILDVQGPTVTVTGGGAPVAEALWLALDWLHDQTADLVLLVAADLFHPVLGYRLARQGAAAEDGRLRALDLDRGGVVPGDVFAALALAPAEASPQPRWGLVGEASELEEGATPLLLSAAGRPDEAGGYRQIVESCPDARVAAYTPLWGTNPVGEALSLVAAAICLADGRSYPVPEGARASAGVDVLEAGPLSRAGELRCAAVEETGGHHVITVFGPESA